MAALDAHRITSRHTAADDLGCETEFTMIDGVLEAYEQWLASPQAKLTDVQALHLTGLFDRPASPDCLAALRQAPAIPGITDALVPLDDDAWNAVLMRLHDCHLIRLCFPPVVEGTSASRSAEPCQVPVDVHPVMREYFAKHLRQAGKNTWWQFWRTKKVDGFKEAHTRLFDHLCETTPHQPDAIDGLQPLYQAVVHGCLAGRHEEALLEVYHVRILRSDGYRCRTKLGAMAENLRAVAAFFENPWSRLSANLSEPAQSWLLSDAAFLLRALGYLTEALEPNRLAIEISEKQEDYENAAIGASNLSHLEVMLGQLDQGVASARRAIAFADHSGEAFQRMVSRTVTADALNQSGSPAERAEAHSLFVHAENLQRLRELGYAQLYSIQGFRYCDLILAPAEREAWQALGRPAVSAWASSSETSAQDDNVTQALSDAELRANTVFEWRAGTVWNPQADAILDIALDHLTLARVKIYRALMDPHSASSFDRHHCSAALDGLRTAGQAFFLCDGLLTASLQHHFLGEHAAAIRCLAEAQQIAERGPMPLFLADVHLHRARLVGSMADAAARERAYPGVDPHAELAKARELITKHGYGRRTEELADAEAAAAAW